MGYSISDFYQSFSDSLQLIAGQGGLAREIDSCGILDYELLPELKDRYSYSNFQNNQFIVTSLLYARENPHLLIDAIKHLLSKGCSGLAIRNVLKLPIPEAAIRYADAKNFPVFLVTSVSLRFEEIIYTIRHQAALAQEIGYHQEILHRILSSTLPGEEIRTLALQLHPSFCDQFFCAYFLLDDFTADLRETQYIQNARSCGLLTYEDFLCPFRRGLRRGFLLVRSGEDVRSSFHDDFFRQFIDFTFHGDTIKHIGISSMHNTLTAFRLALRESFYAAAYTSSENIGWQYYDALGIYQAVFPFCHTPELIHFSRRIINPIEEYDAENNTSLLQTLSTYLICDSSIPETARKLSQHEQTIRYRLNKIYSLTNLDHKSPAQCQELFLACKIHMARQMLAEEI